MKLDFIDLDKLSVSNANMRAGRKAPDIADILPSIRARGILVPILVRPMARPDRFEIVAGRRRFDAARRVAEERGHAEPVPCAIVEAGDDAAALEASLIENIARLDPDKVTRWESFVQLIRKGRRPEEIGATFGLPDVMVRRILALGNLLPRIRDLYRRAVIDATTIRHLTMASKQRQRDWLALFDDPDARTPTGHALKSWLLGGASIRTSVALFDLRDYPGLIVADLFGEESYFADAAMFWEAQNAVIAEHRDASLQAGWREVVLVPPSDGFASWDHVKMPKRKGGRVYIDVRPSGEVVFHEGYCTRREKDRAASGADEPEARPQRPELTSTVRTYVDLHRHAAVRADLLRAPALALRVMVAHMLGGSALWRVSADPRTARNADVAESCEASPAETRFDTARRAALYQLGLPDDTPTLAGCGGYQGAAPLLLRLLELPDDEVMAILCVVMGETLASSSNMVELLGAELQTDMAHWWRADDALFSILRDREVLGEIVAEVAGDAVARANAGEPSKTLKAIVQGHLDGHDGRTKVEGWVPRWMRFAPSAYTERGGVGTVAAHAAIMAIRAERAQQSAGPDAEPASDTADPDPDPVSLAA